MNLLTKIVVLALTAALAVFVFLHILPYLLVSLACFGGYHLYRRLRPPES